jgi:putative endonuclease
MSRSLQAPVICASTSGVSPARKGILDSWSLRKICDQPSTGCLGPLRLGVDVSPPKESWFVYVLCCSDGSIYCGITKNVEQRVGRHNAGKGARYTRGRRPVSVLHFWTVDSRQAALREERAFKALSRQKKIARLRGQNPTEAFLRGCTNDASGKG